MPRIDSPQVAEALKAEDETESAWQLPTLTEWLAETTGQRPWLIQDLVPSDAFVLVSGHQKRAFKTFFAFATGLLLATKKEPALEGQSNLIRVSGGPVLIVEEEGAKKKTQERMLALCNGLGINPIDADENIRIAFRQRVKLDSPAWRQKLMRMVAEMKPVLVIFDALYLLHEGDENKVVDMAPIIDTLNAIRDQGASIMLLVHLDKTRGENRKNDLDAQIRGTSILSNCYDVHLAFRQYETDPETTAPIGLTIRSRDSEPKQFEVSWELKNEEGKLVRARPNIREVVSGAKLWTKAKALLKPGAAYTAETLSVLWEVKSMQTKKLITRGIKEGVLTPTVSDTGEERWICTIST